MRYLEQHLLTPTNRAKIQRKTGRKLRRARRELKDISVEEFARNYKLDDFKGRGNATHFLQYAVILDQIRAKDYGAACDTASSMLTAIETADADEHWDYAKWSVLNDTDIRGVGHAERKMQRKAYLEDQRRLKPEADGRGAGPKK